MLETILNPYNLGWLAVSAFIVGGILAIAVGIAAGLATLWAAREKRDGKR